MASLVLLLVHILLSVINVRGQFSSSNTVLQEEGEEDTIIELEFPYDTNMANTFAEINIVVDEDINNLTTCLAFRVNALSRAKGDVMELFRLWDDEWGERASLELKIEFGHDSLYKASLILGRVNYFSFPSFSLLTWMQACVSFSNKTTTLVSNGFVVETISSPDNLSISTSGVKRGNITLYLGKSMTGSISGVNIFALSLDKVISLTNSMSEDCGKPGTIFNWVDFSSNRKQALASHGSAKNRTMLQIDGPCHTQNQVLIFTNEYTSFLDCMNHCEKLGTRCPSVKTREELDILKDDLQANLPLPLDLFFNSGLQ